MTHEITPTNLYDTLRHRADVEHRELLRAMQRLDQLNARFQSLNDELDRLAETPTHKKDQTTHEPKQNI